MHFFSRQQLLNNNSYQGFKEQRALFRVLRTAIRETQIQVKSKECSGEEGIEAFERQKSQGSSGSRSGSYLEFLEHCAGVLDACFKIVSAQKVRFQSK